MNSKYQKHEPSHEKFLKNADDFCVYTIRLLKDEKICPKSARWLGAEEIVKITQRFHTEVHRANSIKVTNAEEKKNGERKMLIVNRKERIEQREAEIEKMRSENQKLKGIVEYIGAMDYPEIFEEESEEE